MMWSQRDDFIYDRMAGDDHENRIEAARRRNAEIDRAEDERAAKSKADAEQRARRDNAVMQLREYQRAGIGTPPVDGNGYPTVSLTTLLDMGWTIEADGGQNVLVRPAQIRGFGSSQW